jgi:hypothetical protein
MKRCIIHIGMHKTGSTSIQHSFYQHLNNPAWYYGDLIHSNHSYALATLLNATAPGGALTTMRTDQQALLTKLRTDIEEHVGENYLLSAEWLSSHAAGLTELTTLRKLLLEHVDSILVVGYVRTPKSFMESSFQERLKMQAVNVDFTNLCPHYRARLAIFDQVFGKENVLFWKFAPEHFINHCVVQDFCQRLGIEFPLAQIKRVNEGLSKDATALLFMYRSYCHEQITAQTFTVKENLQLIDCLTQLHGSKLKFASAAVESTLLSEHADIAWMEQRLGESLNEDLETDAEAIHHQDQLMHVERNTLQWLAEQIDAQLDEHTLMSAEEIAHWVLQLQLKLRTDNSTASTDQLNAKELLRNAKKNVPELSSLSELQGLALIKHIFSQINTHTAAMEEGELKVAGLGRFKITQIQRERRGLMISVKRIQFYYLKQQQRKGH